MWLRLVAISLALLLQAAPAWGAIAFVQVTGNNAETAATTIAAPAQNHTGGNFLYVCVSSSGSGENNPLSGVADTAGNTYSNVLTATQGTLITVTVWRAFNITGNASNVVTATYTASSNIRRIIVAEYSGVRTATSPNDGSGSDNASTGTALNTVAFTTTFANDVLIGCGYNSLSATYTPGTNFTERREQGAPTDTALYLEDRIVSVTGSYTCPATADTDGAWAMTCAAFMEPAAATGRKRGALIFP